jgi:hypothetical protein
LTVATEVLEEDQVPPEVTSARVVVDPAQTAVVPVMPATTGKALTVAEVVELEVQPDPLVTV